MTRVQITAGPHHFRRYGVISSLGDSYVFVTFRRGTKSYTYSFPISSVTVLKS